MKFRFFHQDQICINHLPIWLNLGLFSNFESFLLGSAKRYRSNLEFHCSREAEQYSTKKKLSFSQAFLLQKCTDLNATEFISKKILLPTICLNHKTVLNHNKVVKTVKKIMNISQN